MNVISSRQTFFIKKVFPVIWLGFVVVFFIGSIASGALKQAPMFLVMPVVMFVFGFFLFRHFVWDLADEVKDAGDHLIVRKGDVEDRIALRDIMNISVSITNPPRLTMRLRKPGKFGSEVVFTPIKNFSFNPFAKNAVAEDLIVRVDRVREEK